jgi:hypothetical protein
MGNAKIDGGGLDLKPFHLSVIKFGEYEEQEGNTLKEVTSL